MLWQYTPTSLLQTLSDYTHIDSHSNVTMKKYPLKRKVSVKVKNKIFLFPLIWLPVMDWSTENGPDQNKKNKINDMKMNLFFFFFFFLFYQNLYFAVRGISILVCYF